MADEDGRRTYFRARAAARQRKQRESEFKVALEEQHYFALVLCSQPLTPAVESLVKCYTLSCRAGMQ